MAIFKTEITVSGSGGPRMRVFRNPNAGRMCDGDGFADLDWQSAEKLAEELKVAAHRMRAIEEAIK